MTEKLAGLSVILDLKFGKIKLLVILFGKRIFGSLGNPEIGSALAVLSRLKETCVYSITIQKLLANEIAMTSPLPLALLGISHPHAPGMVRQILAHPQEFTLVALHDPHLEDCDERVDTWKAESPQTHVCHELTEALQHEVDAVVVEGAVHENMALAQQAVEAGLPVLLEKPAGGDWPAFERLMKSAQRKNLHVQLIYLFRYMAAIQALFRFAEEGRFGQIYEFRGRLPKELALYEEHEQEFSRYPGGMFFEMGGHLIDFAVHLLGPPSKIHNIMRHDHPTHGGAFVDNGVALLEHESAVSILEVTTLEAAPDSRRIEVFGTEGAFVIPHLGSGHLSNNAAQDYQAWTNGDAAWQHHSLPVAKLQIGDLREFSAVLRGEKEAEFSAEHDACVQRTLLSACGMI